MLNKYVNMLNLFEEIIREACGLYLNDKVKYFQHKSVNDILTDTDIKMQEYLLAKIKTLYPEIVIIAEEKTNAELSNDLSVCVDPLDGTCNFSTGIPIFGVQMAVFKNKEIIASIIFLPQYNEVYKAIKGQGATLNGKKLELNKNIKQEESVLILSDFYPNIEIQYERQFKLVQHLQSHFLKIRLFGAACFDFVSLATSKAQAYICYYHELWDIAPGLLIVQELGLKAEGLTRPYILGDSVLVVALTDSIIKDIKKVYLRLTETK